MSEQVISERLRFLEKEVSALAEDLDRNKLDLRSQVDALRLDIESIKTFLKKHFPELPETFRDVKDQTMREKNPEWIAEQD